MALAVAAMPSSRRADLRPFADQGHLEIGDAAAARGDTLDRVFEELIRGGALPFHIAWREMRTDVAVGQCAEDRVDQRVQPDVAVGVGEKAPGVGHAHTADHDVVAVAEGVHVVAGAGPDVAELSGKARFLADEIFRRREFHVGSIALKRRDRQSHPFGERRIICEIRSSLARGAAVGIEYHVILERLRRLRDPQPRPLGRGFDISGTVDQLDGVVHGNRGDRRAGLGGGLDRA